jgi:guanine deaminase
VTLLTDHGLRPLAGCVLLATGEPCGLCYRFAIGHRIDTVYVATDGDRVASLGFDYRASYAALGITDAERDSLFRRLAVLHGTEPFTRYLHLRFSGRAVARSGTVLKGQPSS